MKQFLSQKIAASQPVSTLRFPQDPNVQAQELVTELYKNPAELCLNHIPFKFYINNVFQNND